MKILKGWKKKLLLIVASLGATVIFFHDWQKPYVDIGSQRDKAISSPSVLAPLASFLRLKSHWLLNASRKISESSSPVSSQFLMLKSKVLKTPQEEALFHTELVSSYHLAAVMKKLQAIPSEADDEESVHKERKERMALIDWIDEALSWKENPRRAEIIEELSKLISREVSSLPLRTEVKETLAGDKIELIGLLGAVNSQLLQTIEQASAGSKEEKLFQYARAMYGLPSHEGGLG